MKNIIDERPTIDLHGRISYCTRFITDEDIKNKNILDIGCGFGWFELNAISRRVKHIIGLDLSENDLETAKKHIKLDKANFQVGNALNLPFKSNSFDTVVSWEVIEHIPKNREEKMFQEVYRVLKPNGIFYLSTPNKSILCNLLDPAWWLVGHRHYPQNFINRIANKTGFQIEKTLLRGAYWGIASINNLYISKWIFHREPFFKTFFSYKEDKEFLKDGFTTIFMKMKKKDTKNVLLVDSYSLNSGDIAILMSLTNELKKIKGLNILIEASHPKQIQKINEFRNYSIIPRIFDIQELDPPFLKFKYLKQIMIGIYDLASFLIWVLFRRVGIDFLWIIRQKKRDQALLLENTDYILSVGGGFLSTNYFYSLRLYIQLLAYLLNKPFLITGQSIGPFESIFSRIFIPKFLNQCRLITVREPYSLEYLKNFKISKRVIETSDYAFLLKATKTRTKKKYVSIIVRFCEDRIKQQNYEKIIHQIVQELISGGYHIRIVAQTFSDNQFNFKMLPKEKVEVYEFGLTPIQLKQIYCESEFIISSRMHAIIFASEQKIPFICIPYEPKFYGLLKQMKYDKKLVIADADLNSEVLSEAVDYLIKNKTKISNSLKIVIPNLKKRAKNNTELIAEYIRGN